MTRVYYLGERKMLKSFLRYKFYGDAIACILFMDFQVRISPLMPFWFYELVIITSSWLVFWFTESNWFNLYNGTSLRLASNAVWLRRTSKTFIIHFLMQRYAIMYLESLRGLWSSYSVITMDLKKKNTPFTIKISLDSRN